MEYDLSFCFELDLIVQEQKSHIWPLLPSPMSYPLCNIPVLPDNISFDSDISFPIQKKRTFKKNWTL